MIYCQVEFLSWNNRLKKFQNKDHLDNMYYKGKKSVSKGFNNAKGT